MWIESVIEGHWFQAKISGTPVRTGIGGGRVFKLLVSKLDRFVQFDQEHCCYNFDRSLDFDNAPSGLIDTIVAWCENA